MVTFNPLAARDRDLNAYNDVLADRRPDTYRSEAAAVGNGAAQEVATSGSSARAA